jgi:F-type H+-transporting ATPase subunit epsilon
MSGTLALTLLSPVEPDLELRNATRVVARDASGSFAILPGHADFVAALVPCLLEWTDAAGTTRYVGVPGGILRTTAGNRVEVMARRHYAGQTAAAVAAALRGNVGSERAADDTRRQALDRLEAEIAGQLARRLAAGPT